MQRCYKAGRGLPYLFGQEHGIIPPDGNETRNKFFVVLGYDADYVYGGVVINSRINRNLRQSIKDYHYKISRERYTFLRYDSFIDSSSLIIAKQHKLIAAKCVGTLHSDDLDNVIGAVRESPDTSPMDLKRFGLN